VVQNPYDPQSLNRYTYCRNNPIIYSDPSGHFAFGFGDFLGLASIAFNWQNSLLNIAGHAAFGQVNSFSDAMRYSYQGQVIGAAVGATVGAGTVFGADLLAAGVQLPSGETILAAAASVGGGYLCSRQPNCTSNPGGGPGDGPADRQLGMHQM